MSPVLETALWTLQVASGFPYVGPPLRRGPTYQEWPGKSCACYGWFPTACGPLGGNLV